MEEREEMGLSGVGPGVVRGRNPNAVSKKNESGKV